MTNEPLMLSDTAMMLLRQSIENADFINTFNGELRKSPLSPLSLEYGQREQVVSENAYDVRRQIHEELLLDIWCLWAYPDIPILRYLEWHVVLDAHLMVLAEKAFLAYHRHLWLVPRNVNHLIGTYFIPELEAAYKRGWAIHTQTKTTP